MQKTKNCITNLQYLQVLINIDETRYFSRHVCYNLYMLYTKSSPYTFTISCSNWAGQWVLCSVTAQLREQCSIVWCILIPNEYSYMWVSRCQWCTLDSHANSTILNQLSVSIFLIILYHIFLYIKVNNKTEFNSWVNKIINPLLFSLSCDSYLR